MTDARVPTLSGPRFRRWEPHTETVIITHELRGKGETDDPFRRILTVWTLDGEKLAEADDPHPAPCLCIASGGMEACEEHRRVR